MEVVTVPSEWLQYQISGEVLSKIYLAHACEWPMRKENISIRVVKHHSAG